MTSQYIYFIIFFCIAYLILTDSSVAKGVYLLSQFVRIQYEKLKWWIFYNPKNPIVKYLMWRNSMKLAEELMKEFENKNK